MSPQPGSTLSPGDALRERYRVERFLASGGMGEVYVARDTELDRRVAVKLLRPASAARQTNLNRFQREAKALSRVNHPNVVGIYDVGHHGERLFIVMEYVDGETLDDVLEETHRLSLEETVDVVSQVAEGLSEVHALGVVHLDVKPGNILLRSLHGGRRLAKIADFGLARPLQTSQLGATIPIGTAGTPLYMSPEQITSRDVDGRADLYSLGVVAFELLTGRPPLIGHDTYSILRAQVEQAPPRLSEVAADLTWPAGLEDELHRALAKNAADRHEGVLAFAAAFRRASGVGGAERPTSDVRCPTCGAQRLADGHYCGTCGGLLPVDACPRCGHRHAGAETSCSACGASLLPAARRGRVREAVPELGVHTATVLIARAADDPDRPTLVELAEQLPAAVEREGGRCLALMGSEGVALFGLGGHSESPSQGATRAAIALKWAVEDATIGLATGPVWTRGTGSAWGTAIATGPAVEAARSAARAARAAGVPVAVDRAVRREVQGFYESQALPGGHFALGRRRELTWSLHAALGAEDGAFVGREAELAHLRMAATRARTTWSLVVVPLIGPSGVGKSRLAHEFLRELADDAGDWVVEGGRCSPEGWSQSYEPFAGILRTRLRLDEGVRATELGRRLAALPGLDAPGASAQSRAHALTRLLSLGPEAQTLELPRPATPVERQAAFDAYASYVRGVASEQPLVLFIDDLQWADEPTLELLAHLVVACSDAPLLVVLALRDRAADALLEGLRLPPTRSLVLPVGPLPEAQTRALLTELVGGEDLPEALVGAVVAFASGVPLGVVEAVESFVDHGILAVRGDGYEVAARELGAAALEKTLYELMLERLGRLQPGERRLLEAVVAAGAGAPRSMLVAMLERSVDADIETLRQRGLLQLLGRGSFAGERELAVSQALLADVVRDATPAQRGKPLHARAAEWLLSWRGPRVPGLSAMAARHFQLAGMPQRAAKLHLSAARQAMAQYANAAAYQAYGDAGEAAAAWLDLEADNADAREVLLAARLGRAELAFRRGEITEALAVAQIAAQLAESGGGHGEAHAQALCVQGEALEGEARYEEAISAFERAAAVAGEGGHEGLAVYAVARQAATLMRAGLPEEAQTLAEEALEGREEGATEASFARGLGSLHATLGHLKSRAGLLEEAAQHFERSQAHRSHAGDAIGAAMTPVSLGNLAYRAGDLGRARAHYEAAAAACEKAGYAQGLAIARANLGQVLLEQGKSRDALAQLALAESTVRRIGAVDYLPEILLNRARALAQRGSIGEAREVAEAGLEVARDYRLTADEGKLAAFVEGLDDTSS